MQRWRTPRNVTEMIAMLKGLHESFKLFQRLHNSGDSQKQCYGIMHMVSMNLSKGWTSTSTCATCFIWEKYSLLLTYRSDGPLRSPTTELVHTIIGRPDQILCEFATQHCCESLNVCHLRTPIPFTYAPSCIRLRYGWTENGGSASANCPLRPWFWDFFWGVPLDCHR
jgi:hypothetical protein